MLAALLWLFNKEPERTEVVILFNPLAIPIERILE